MFVLPAAGSRKESLTRWALHRKHLNLIADGRRTWTRENLLSSAPDAQALDAMRDDDLVVSGADGADTGSNGSRNLRWVGDDEWRGGGFTL